jgi:hypothetical protein
VETDLPDFLNLGIELVTHTINMTENQSTVTPVPSPHSAGEQPRVLLLSIHHDAWFYESYHPHLDKLAAKARLLHARDARSAMHLLSEAAPPPAAVLVTDSAVAGQQHTEVCDALLGYIRRGGTAILMAGFPNCTPYPAMRAFFELAGLPWSVGCYLRSTLALNREAVGPALAAKLPARYSQKAVFVRDVGSGEAWYRTDEQSVMESLVWAAEPIDCPGEAPVAVEKVGDGRLAYIGDVNAEDGTGEVILALCGLL